MTSISRLLLSVAVIGSVAAPAFAQPRLHAVHRHAMVHHVGLTHDVGGAATPAAKPGITSKSTVPAKPGVADATATPAVKAN